MADLFNKQINETYQGLLKSNSNGVIGSSLSQITDGRGNGSQLYLSTSTINFYGSYSFPSSDGLANQILKTDGSGSLTWQDDVNSSVLTVGSDNSDDTTITLSTQKLQLTGTVGQIDTTTSAQTVTFSFPYGGVVLPNGSRATTQSNSDSSQKVATTAFVANIAFLNFATDNGADGVDLTTAESLEVLGATNEISTSASTRTITIGFPSTGTVLPDGSTATTQNTSDNTTKIATTNWVKTTSRNFSGDTGSSAGSLQFSFPINGTTNEIVTLGTGSAIKIGFPSAGVTLPNNSVATTQSSTDDSTKIATTEFVQDVVGGVGGGTVTSVALTVPTGLTVTGSPITTSGTLAIGGTLGVANGGTGVTSLTGILLGNGTNVISGIASSTNGDVLTANGSGGYSFTTPTDGTVTSVGLSVPTGFTVTGSPITTSGTLAIGGTLSVSSGGTGATSLTGILLGNGASAISAITSATNGDVLTADGSGGYSFATPSGGGGGDVTKTGTITQNQIAVWNNNSDQLRSDGNITISTDTIDLAKFVISGVAYTNVDSSNTGFGENVLANLSGGGSYGNVGIGANALRYSTTNVYKNVGIGTNALTQATSHSNTAIGYDAGSNSSLSGNNNTFIGMNSGNDVTTGSANIILGGNAGSGIAASNNNIILSDGVGNIRMQFNSSGYGFMSSSTARLGIRKSFPTAALDVTGTIKSTALNVTGGTATANVASSIVNNTNVTLTGQNGVIIEGDIVTGTGISGLVVTVASVTNQNNIVLSSPQTLDVGYALTFTKNQALFVNSAQNYVKMSAYGVGNQFFQPQSATSQYKTYTAAWSDTGKLLEDTKIFTIKLFPNAFYSRSGGSVNWLEIIPARQNRISVIDNVTIHRGDTQATGSWGTGSNAGAGDRAWSLVDGFTGQSMWDCPNNICRNANTIFYSRPGNVLIATSNARKNFYRQVVGQGIFLKTVNSYSSSANTGALPYFVEIRYRLVSAQALKANVQATFGTE